MSVLYGSFTAVMVLASMLCGIHAWKNQNITLYGSTIVYGIVLEKLVILYFQSYTYPADRMLDAFGIPLAIGFGWSVVIYSAYVIAKTFNIHRHYLPVFTGLYAVHLDLAMDAIAIRVPYWEWLGNGDWFGVPLGNFLGWYLVAALFALIYEWLSDRTTDPILLGGGSILGSVLLLLPILNVWTEVTGNSTVREATILALLLVSSLIYLSRADIQPQPISPLITSSVFLFHGFFFGVLVALNLYEAKPLLLLLSLAMIAIGVAIHLWPAANAGVLRRSIGMQE